MNEKKVRIISVLFLVLIVSLIVFCNNSSFVLAAENASTDLSSTLTANLSGFDLSYSCLKEQINKRGVPNMTNEELAFSLLAMGYDSSLKSKIANELENRKSNDGCWPKNGCKVKETSEILLAYYHIGKANSKGENWLYNQSKADTDLVWYLEIDTNNPSQCKITYDNSAKNVNINDDKTLSGGAGSCLSLAYNGYWLQINPNCYGKEFKISCNNDFLTTLIYKTKTDQTLFVSETTHTAAVNGETSEKVNSYCFKEGSTCSYEASLWATLVLQVKEKEITGYLPYLRALSSNNDKSFPSSFLYSLTGFDEYYSDIVNEQNAKGYWQLTDSMKRYYDTALALRGLYGRDSEAYNKAVDYLLSPSVLGNGCWNGNNIRDTAFILYSGYPKQASSDTGESSQCTDFSYSCTSSTECETRNGTELPNFRCFGGLICCNKQASLKSCNQLSGVLCSADERCNGEAKPSSDNKICCIGDCIQATTDQYTCESLGVCRTECSSGEEADSSYTCGDGVCCVQSSTTQGKSYWWVWLLVILIILLGLAIYFRNQLKVWLFKMKSDFSKSPVGNSNRPPSFPPQPPAGGMGRRLIPQQPMRLPPRQPMQQRPFPKDRELDATLKKIRDMGK
jgi:hypothetical protein